MLYLGLVSFSCIEYFTSFENSIETVAVFLCLIRQLEKGEGVASDIRNWRVTWVIAWQPRDCNALRIAETMCPHEILMSDAYWRSFCPCFFAKCINILRQPAPRLQEDIPSGLGAQFEYVDTYRLTKTASGGLRAALREASGGPPGTPTGGYTSPTARGAGPRHEPAIDITPWRTPVHILLYRY